MHAYDTQHAALRRSNLCNAIVSGKPNEWVSCIICTRMYMLTRTSTDLSERRASESGWIPSHMASPTQASNVEIEQIQFSIVEMWFYGILQGNTKTAEYGAAGRHISSRWYGSVANSIFYRRDLIRWSVANSILHNWRCTMKNRNKKTVGYRAIGRPGSSRSVLSVANLILQN